ncbi:Na+/H+ antiporter NhaC family protein [Xanthovirga aplysinae]|uniref:Na+/H+ antiporter NhaC family protein n=1 Tax=Xanthovirga aplysinae TaxID=2529853 RepID=UPI0012BB679F|nr:Na+/H+ antiporter NhaC family protein [Xanthovirga aplysinae]MTI32830.1 Na+/H+ antiporter NhaC family protein [Xanthovirga aplysinae]
MKDILLKKGNPWALLPLVVFMLLILIVSVIAGDFYKMPLTVSFMITSGVALLLKPKMKLSEKLEIFTKGAGNSNIMLMCVIFLLAGAFAHVAKAMGAVEATVNFGLTFLSGNFLLAGIFVIGCFISLSVGTSVGTIVALTPMALGIAEAAQLDVGLALASVIGGAMFGDNLSLISDTTIAATRTQGCSMGDKFRMNFFIALPAAVLTILIYLLFYGATQESVTTAGDYELIKIVPYLVVLVFALAGIHVTIVLGSGIVLGGVIGLWTSSFGLWDFTRLIGEGIGTMSELIIICLLIGGIVSLIQYHGGIDYILNFITSRIKNQRGAEMGIAILVVLVNICTANNTIALLTTGPIAKQIADKYEIKPKRTASLIDTFSCFCQGIIPYGAQSLTAVTIAASAGLLVSPWNVMRHLYYPYLLGLSALVVIFITAVKVKTKLRESVVA